MKWTMPDWMEKYAGKYVPDKETTEFHMNVKTNVVINAPLSLMAADTAGKVGLLNALHRDGLIT